MMMGRTIRMGLVGAALLAAGAAYAHHGWGNYDSAKAFTITQPLAEVSWSNPHVSVQVRHEGATWDVILAPASRMQTRGISADMLKPGVPVAIEGYPHRSGKPEMRAERITVNGKTVELR